MSVLISLTPQEVEQRLDRIGIHCRFTDSERQALAATDGPDAQAGILRFPIPEDNSSLTLRKIRDAAGCHPARQPSFFDHPWYQDEAFMDVHCKPGWHHLYMDVLPESVGQPSDYARSLAARGLQPAYAVEVVLMLFLHYLGTGEQLLLRKHTWCADPASGGRVVTVGAFGRNGVFLSAHPPGFGSRGLGVCPKLAVGSG